MRIADPARQLAGGREPEAGGKCASGSLLGRRARGQEPPCPEGIVTPLGCVRN